MIVKIGPVHAGVTARAETSALLEAAGVVIDSHELKIRLRVAAQTEVVVTDHEHLVVHGAVHFVAGGAAFSQRFMLPDKRALLVFVAFETSLIDILESRGRPWTDFLTMGRVTIDAGHFSL